jgi:hypothetical protein
VPRPYNLIGIEGAYGRERGLHGVDVFGGFRGFGDIVTPNSQILNAPDVINAAEVNAAFASITPAVGPMGGGTLADLLNNVAANPNYVGSLQPSFASTAVAWIQQNWPILAVGVVAIIALKRR